MNNEKTNKRISKFLSLVLRHKPEAIDIQLDESGWADVGLLLQKFNQYGVTLDLDTLNHVVETNNKKRFAFNESRDKIRASQGHSIQIALGYEPQVPPEMLYHGTGSQSVDSILSTGIESRRRQHVHLSKDIETAINVGSRHGKPVVLEVLAGQMHQDGFEFFLSENGVWLIDSVPVRYLRRK
jgi:putative RNA 2'-phosphotransferase